MSLDEKFTPVRAAFNELIANLFQTIAGLFGFPKNPGIPFNPAQAVGISKSDFIDRLPKHITFWPPIQRPQTLFEMIVGPAPKIDAVPRYSYQSQEEGFYNFYIPNYKNIYFLPNWLSEFIQVRFHICTDITVLESLREVLFVTLMVYSQLLIFRIALGWLLYINPYTVPWCYLIAVIDWTEEGLQGMIPSILGVNVAGAIFLGVIGVAADSLNHLVFTMPYLPMEGEQTTMLINKRVTEVLVFHYLPILWYRYPIPNELREFWYKERPDILEYMEKAYQNLDIQFLPDNIIRQLNQEKLTGELSSFSNSLISQNSNLNHSISSEILSQNNLSKADMVLTNIHFGNEEFYNLILSHIEKLN
jgi:hypothetical protein